MKQNRINISEILEPSSRYESVEKNKKYKILGMRGEGNGLFLREEKYGNEISASYLNKVSTGDFIYSRLFAWKGSFAIVPEAFDKTYVSSEFPCFKINTKKIDSQFLLYYFTLRHVWNEVEQLSFGSTKQSRNRLKEELFLTLSIPIPPLTTQIAIVKKLNAIKDNCGLIQTLRKEQQNDFKKLIYIKYSELTKNCEWVLFKTVSPIIRRPFEPNNNEDYIEIGIKSFGNGTFQKPPVKGKQIAHKSLFKINAGDLIFSNVFAWEGAIAIAVEKDDICIGSHRFITSVPDKETIQPEFLLYHLLSLRGNQDINKASPGTAGRNKTLGITKLENILVPLPALDNQNEFAELLHKINNHYCPTKL